MKAIYFKERTIMEQIFKVSHISLKKVALHSLKKCNPFTLFHNPVIFITEIGAIITTWEAMYFQNNAQGFGWQISIWLWLTVLFSNASETIAEFQNKGQAEAIKNTRKSISALKKILDGSLIRVTNFELRQHDICLVKAGELIPADGQIIEGAAAIDESSVTGESQPVIRKANTDNDTVIAGTKVLSDQILIRVAEDHGQGYLDKLVHLIETSKRKKSQSEISLSLLLSSLTLIFLIVIITFEFFGFYYDVTIHFSSQIAFLICLIPTTIAGLLNAIGIAGINRLIKKNVLALSGKSIEAAGEVNVLVFDKTGTLTFGNRAAQELTPSLGTSERDFHKACYFCSLADQTPEGISITELIKKKFPGSIERLPEGAKCIPFSAYTRLSGIDAEGEEFRKGSIDAITNFCQKPIPNDLSFYIQKIAHKGGTPLVVATKNKILGVIFLMDKIKKGLPEKFAEIKKMGVQTLLVTGDNQITAQAIADEAGIDQAIANISPEQKLELMKNMQAKGLVIGMTGDGVNDALALAQADLAVAMHEGAQAAKEAANMIDLESNPSKLYEIIQIGKQMVVTRGALTTFSISTDIAKFFIVLPSILLDKFPILKPLNLLNLSSPRNAIISTVIFNALILLGLIPLAYKGVKFTGKSSQYALQRNLIIYGMGGLVVPFFLIKIIDLILDFIQRVIA
jgi:K+-transporting ATPase ATPase B chain